MADVNQQFLGKKGFNHEKSIENGLHQAFLGDFWGISIIHELGIQFVTNLYGKQRGLTWFNHPKWEDVVDIMGYMTKNVSENGGFCPPIF